VYEAAVCSERALCVLKEEKHLFFEQTKLRVIVGRAARSIAAFFNEAVDNGGFKV
jgi:hypothetical protein